MNICNPQRARYPQAENCWLREMNNSGEVIEAESRKPKLELGMSPTSTGNIEAETSEDGNVQLSQAEERWAESYQEV